MAAAVIHQTPDLIGNGACIDNKSELFVGNIFKVSETFSWFPRLADFFFGHHVFR